MRVSSPFHRVPNTSTSTRSLASIHASSPRFSRSQSHPRNPSLTGQDCPRERKANKQQLGETVLLWSRSRLIGFACCHCGEGTEAGTDTCYIKFGAVLPGPAAAESFDQLLLACEALAISLGLSHLVAGVNLGRQEAHQRLLASGFRADMVGIAMEKPNEPGYNHEGVYLIDDWR